MRDSRTLSCPSKCDKIFPSVWYVFQHKPNFFCEMRLLERRSGNMTCFFFLSYPFSVLQNEGCVYCALGCVMTISKSCFCSLWRYSTHTSHLWALTARTTTETTYCSANHFYMYVPVWPLCFEDWSPAVEKDLSVPQPQLPTWTVWCSYLLLTHNWKLTFF